MISIEAPDLCAGEGGERHNSPPSVFQGIDYLFTISVSAPRNVTIADKSKHAKLTASRPQSIQKLLVSEGGAPQPGPRAISDLLPSWSSGGRPPRPRRLIRNCLRQGTTQATRQPDSQPVPSKHGPQLPRTVAAPRRTRPFPCSVDDHLLTRERHAPPLAMTISIVICARHDTICGSARSTPGQRDETKDNASDEINRYVTRGSTTRSGIATQHGISKCMWRGTAGNREDCEGKKEDSTTIARHGGNDQKKQRQTKQSKIVIEKKKKKGTHKWEGEKEKRDSAGTEETQRGTLARCRGTRATAQPRTEERYVHVNKE
ncbi:hypothetical protein HETIRDRAFT_313161 [Heterobasidion irregulare TC 32-1]|uniref:Uncharacterized protein n=1 Tax=Heterobasidion irregulare (strain TC 32-1) TaxID=747525 RepID=W4KER2_HETIT|nr:uncharacterized protein HETIRDRAFT_313161 [Heterobasidion irregulare TC 32-1]ETW84322.1 hypothetical protein HETIRDRAFT_313161 [Heterobasidion irregulare TC 32-1]